MLFKIDWKGLKIADSDFFFFFATDLLRIQRLLKAARFIVVILISRLTQA